MSKNSHSLYVMYIRLWGHLSSKRRQQFCYLLILIVTASLLEIFSIGAIVPFLYVLTDPSRILSNHYGSLFLEQLGLNTPSDLVLPITLAFIGAVLIASSFRLILIWLNAKVSFGAGAELSTYIYQRTLYQPYAVHISRNSGEVISGIISKSSLLIYNAMMPALTIISSVIILTMILVVLLIANPVLSLISFGGFSAIYFVVVILVKRELFIDSQLISQASNKIIKTLQEGLGGIRDVLIDGLQEEYCKSFEKAELELTEAQARNTFIGSSPRLIIEAIGIAFIAIIALHLSREPDGLVTAIPSLGVLALAAQRMLPMLQNSYGAWVAIHGQMASIVDAIDLLDQPLPSYIHPVKFNSIHFNHSIKLVDASFNYGKSNAEVLKNINLIIPKGNRTGIIGPTGSGKSTLIDILMGLLTPVCGSLQIDCVTINDTNRREWQSRLSHVPQNVFLADCSIAENIAFGIPKSEIDMERVHDAAKKAQIHNTICSLPDKYATSVGERGVRLSGGQRQRLGIARALYKKADVIVFDEATNSLDGVTEEAVINAIENIGSDITVIMIAHRLSTLKNCNQIIELRDGKISRILSYSDISSEYKV